MTNLERLRQPSGMSSVRRATGVWTLKGIPAGFAGLLVACGGTLDAGSDRAPPGLPVGPDNPVILVNDNVYDNWHGEYALLLAQAGAPRLAGVVVGVGSQWLDLDANVGGWQDLVAAARSSGMAKLPELVRSKNRILRRPVSGIIEETVPNGSLGAQYIAQTSRRLAEPGKPLVVATGSRLTDVADAYLSDPTVAERIVVVASVGSGFAGASGVAKMGIPNGEQDPWADSIVIERLRYVQVSARYSQLTDVPSDRLAALPDNEFGAWIRAKQPDIFDIDAAADQVSVIASGIPAYVTGFARVSHTISDREPPTMTLDPEGADWLVTTSDSGAATARFWQLLLDPMTFGG